MLALVVQIDSGRATETRTRVFHESPVRIGRSPFANLRLREPFVSEWHAVVRFNAMRTTYLDLGAKNRTLINGRPAERNVEVEIDADSDIRIGTLRLRLSRSEQPIPAADPASDEQSAFAPQLFGEPERPTGTQLLPASLVPDLAKLPLPAATRAAHFAARTLRATPPQPPPPKLAVEPASDAVLTAHRGYRRACREFLQLVCARIEATPNHARAAAVIALRRSFPELVHEPLFRDAAERAGVRAVQLGQLDPPEWLARLCGTRTSATPEQTVISMERVGQLLEIFAAAFIDSRRAHQRARRRLALDTGALSATPLARSEDPHELLAYLLDPEADVRARSQELRRTLADFAMHQIALLSAVVEGARTLLDQLGPQALQDYREPAYTEAALDQNASWTKLGPFAARKLWRRFVVRHRDLTAADYFTRALFGREFQRRYHAIADNSERVEAPNGRARRAVGAAS